MLSTNSVNHNHRKVMEYIYARVRFPEAIDYWAAHFAEDEIDVAISNARHLDSHRQKLENMVWQRYFPQSGRFLDCACGAGFFMQRLSEAIQENSFIIGIDISYSVLKYAKARYNHFPFLNADGTALPFKDGSFDGVLVISTLEHVRENLPVLLECSRVLKPEGILYLCVHKHFFDPFIFPSLLRKSKRLIKKALEHVGVLQQADIGAYPYSRPIAEVRQTLLQDFQKAGFDLLEKRALLHTFEWRFYKKFLPWAIPFFIRLGELLNRLPFGYYKNLEYWVWRKKRRWCI